MTRYSDEGLLTFPDPAFQGLSTVSKTSFRSRPSRTPVDGLNLTWRIALFNSILETSKAQGRPILILVLNRLRWACQGWCQSWFLAELDYDLIQSGCWHTTLDKGAQVCLERFKVWTTYILSLLNSRHIQRGTKPWKCLPTGSRPSGYHSYFLIDYNVKKETAILPTHSFLHRQEIYSIILVKFRTQIHDRTGWWVENHKETQGTSSSSQPQTGSIRYIVLLLGPQGLNLKWLPASRNWTVWHFKMTGPSGESYIGTAAV